MAKASVTFHLPAIAYAIIHDEAVSRGAASTLLPESRGALAAAAQLAYGVWVVDCTEEVSHDIEDWFKQTAAVEAALPQGGRFKILNRAVRAIRAGREKSRREHGAR